MAHPSDGQKICPRCGEAHVELLAVSPVTGVWQVYQCQHCLYT